MSFAPISGRSSLELFGGEVCISKWNTALLQRYGLGGSARLCHQRVVLSAHPPTHADNGDMRSPATLCHSLSQGESLQHEAVALVAVTPLSRYGEKE